MNDYQNAETQAMHQLKQAQQKLREENEYQNARMADANIGKAVQGIGLAGSYRPSLREEAERNVGFHQQQADRAVRAAAFFREHPEFDEFIRLIREGVVSI